MKTYFHLDSGASLMIIKNITSLRSGLTLRSSSQAARSSDTARRASMIGRRTTHELSSFSWKRAAELSAAKQRLSVRTGVPPRRSGEQQSVGRIIGYCIMLAILLAAIFVAIAFALRWPGVMRFYHGADFRSARACLSLQRHPSVPDPAVCRHIVTERQNTHLLG